MNQLLVNILLVGAGGFAGSVARYCAGLLVPAGAGFPWATLGVNLLGCFLIGFVTGLSNRLASVPSEVRMLLGTGFCGGFTTFSTFVNENYGMLAQGAGIGAAFYILLSVVGGLAMVWAGYWLAALLAE